MCKVNSSLSLHGLDRRSGGQTHWVPNTDVFVMENTLVIKVELAGIQREQLELFADGSRLHICGERPDTCRAAGCKFLVMEVNYGPFECVLEIPKDRAKIVLGITLGRRSHLQRTISLLQMDLAEKEIAFRSFIICKAGTMCGE